MTRRRIGIAVALVAALIVALVVARDVVAVKYWGAQARLGLTDAQRARVEACEDPGTTAVVRIVAQDLVPPCPAETSARWLAASWRTWGVSGWTREAALSPLGRLRVGLAEWLATERGDLDVAARFDAPGAAVEGDALVDRIAEGALDGGFVDPALRLRARLRRPSVGTLDLHDLAEVLAELEVAPGAMPDVERQARVAALVALLDPQDVGGPLRAACAPDAACLHQLRGLVASLAAGEPGFDGGGSPDPAAPPTSVIPTEASRLWRAAWGDDVVAIGAREAVLADVVAWVSVDRPSERIRALLTSGSTSTPMSELGDPAAAFVRRRGGPWASAYGAAVVGAAAGAPVEVRGAGPDAVVRIGREELRFTACGSSGELPPGGVLAIDVVAARAAREAVVAARRSGDVARAARLAGFADRLDPAAAGLAAALAPAGGVGAEIGRRIAGMDSVDPAPWGEWLAAVDAVAPDACPPGLPSR
jgi:hypothetical protein